MTAPDASTAREGPIDSAHGWVLVVLGIGVLTTVWGAVFTFTVYADRLAGVFGLSALQTSSVFSVATGFFLVAGGVVGIFAARFSLHSVLVSVGAGLALAAMLLQVVGSYAGVVVAFALLGTTGGTGFVIVVSVVPQWFDTHQGLATSTTMTGVGIGPLVMPFVWLWLLDRTGLRLSFAVVIGAAAAVVFAASSVYRRPPTDSGSRAAVNLGWIRETVVDSRFLGAAAGYSLLWGWYYVLSAQLVEILTASGLGTRIAAAGLSIIGGVSIGSRIAGGYVGDRVGRRRTFVTSVGFAAGCIAALAAFRSPLVLYAALGGLGVALGPLATLWSPIVLTRFGAENATATVGILNIAVASTAFLAPLAVSALARATGSYTVALLSLSAVTALGGALFYWGTAQRAA